MALSKNPAIMIQATGSNAGKSLLVAGLCRCFTNKGHNVRPFKPQNMSNNAAVTEENGEIGRAQALQARACKVVPSIHMNPVLLKPEGENGAQIVVQGKVHGNAKAREYAALKPTLMSKVMESFKELQSAADIVVVEGAGSPAEVNLRAGDIANMGFAEKADVPVVLVADIDRGGVIANLIGTFAVLTPQERQRIKGFIINKFRGDPSLFADGAKRIEQDTGWPCLGIVPWFQDAARLPAEDSVALQEKSKADKPHDAEAIRIAVPKLPRIANFDDVDPLANEKHVHVIWVEPGSVMPADTDLILLPGSKATMSDLAFLKDQGWDIDIKSHVRRGGHVLGLCGGYQMLGISIHDPDKIEGQVEKMDGLSLLDVETTMAAEKALSAVTGTHCATNSPVTGYEMHMGRTDGVGLDVPFLKIEGKAEGAQSTDGRVAGTYVHGIFANDNFRQAFLSSIRNVDHQKSHYHRETDTILDNLARHLEDALDIDAIAKISELHVGKKIAPSAKITAS